MSLRLPNLLATCIGRLTAFFLLHNSFGAMPDVAIDALAVNTLREYDRGLANGVMFGGAAIGTAVGGAGAWPRSVGGRTPSNTQSWPSAATTRRLDRFRALRLGIAACKALYAVGEVMVWC